MYTAQAVVYCDGIGQMGYRVKCDCGYVGTNIVQLRDDAYEEFVERVELARHDHLRVRHESEIKWE